MRDWHFDSPGPEATREVAAELGRSIGEPGLVIALKGPLGAGKTVFVKGLASGLGVDPREVSSPTFVIANQYTLARGPLVLHHLDFYRLEAEQELDSIGFDDMFARGAVLAVEWADRFPHVLGPDRLEIELEDASARDSGETERVARRPEAERASKRGRAIRAHAVGPEAERVLADWAARVARRSDRADRGDDPSAARLLAMLLIALGIAALARLEPARDSVLCSTPSAVETDALGVRQVVCGADEERWPAQAGVGGLLFGLPIDLNRASPELLETLPQIGPARARAIVESRVESPYASVADLERVSGIGPKTRELLEPWVHVGATRPAGPDPRRVVDEGSREGPEEPRDRRQGGVGHG